jgi:hypothetical protein
MPIILKALFLPETFRGKQAFKEEGLLLLIYALT